MVSKKTPKCSICRCTPVDTCDWRQGRCPHLPPVLQLTIIDKQFETEASGGISLNTIESYAATGVDFISVGAVIHHAVSFDLSLKAVLS